MPVESAGSETTIGGVYRDLVEWGGSLALWQNELLRRIAKGPELTDNDVAELAEAAVKESEDQELPFPRLSAGDFPATAQVDDGIRLVSVGSLKNVNALRADQTLVFGDQLTVVYGHNASGKSGYARVLKKVFRARVVDEILPNLRDDPSAIVGKASAALSFAHAPDDIQPVAWTDGEALPENFARFAVLDAQCSRTYIANNELTIAPEGLELPARVAREVDRVQQHLKTRAIQSRPDRSVLEALVTESPSGLFVKSLSATTTSTDIDEHTRFTESDAKRLESVAGELASLRHDAPAETRKRLATETTNLQSLRAYVATIDQTVSDSSIAQLRQAAKDVSDGEAAAQTMRAIADGATRNEALGTEPWRTLTHAALAYVASVTGNTEALVVDGKCPLCWQELDAAAAARLERFVTYLTSEAEVAVANAKKGLAERRVRISDIPAAPPASHATIATNIGADTTASLASEVSAAHARATATIGALETEAWEAIPAFESLLLNDLDGRLVAVAERQASIADDADIASSIAALAAEHSELDTRRLLSNARSSIEAFVQGLRVAQRYELAARSINTRPISTKASALDEKYLTSAFTQRVRSELKDEMRFARHAPLFASTTVKARTQMRPIVSTDLKDISADRVFSEGERTAIALASFLAEVGITGDTAGLIFDDPISSLDSNIRSHVARRLVKEANTRQVIVLTHDLSFFADLRRAAKDQSVDCQSRTLTADEWSVGVVESDMPFGARNVTDRIQVLKAMIAQAESSGAAGHGADARDTLQHFYSRLRSTWERFVETEMLGGVVERLEKDVRPGLFYQIVVTDEIKAYVNQGYTRCSDVIEAHDHPPGAGQQLPSTQDMTLDLALLETARKAVRDGRKANT